MEEVEDEPLFCERVAGIDIGKKMVMVTIRVPSETRKGGRAAGDPGVRHHAAGAAGAGGLAAVPGRWSRRAWSPPPITGSRCTSCWSGRASTAPCTRRRRSRRCPGGRRPTSWTRRGWRRSPSGGRWPGRSCRRRTSAGCARTPATARKLVQMRTAQKERCEKLLEDAHLKLSSVISDIHGVSGRDMLGAIAAGERNPEGARGDGTGRDARQDRPAGRGPGLLVLHPRARLRPADDAGQHRPAHRPDRGAGRARSRTCASRTSGRSPSSTASPASGSPPPRTSSPRSAST